MNYQNLTTEEKLSCISLFPEEAKKDANVDIRQEAYQTLGYTEEAKTDIDWSIRREAYRALGYTEEAKKDAYWSIRREVESYFKVKNELNK